MSAFLSTRGVTYRLHRRALVEGVSLDIALGQTTIVIGPNGAGKSTLLKLLSGELTPTSGDALCEGERISRAQPWSLACKRAVMSQSSQISFPFTVREVVRLGQEGIGKGLSPSRREDIVARCLDAVDVFPLTSRRYETLSGGEQRRVQFARALAQLEAGQSVSKRQALLLDEPVANLDLLHQLALLDRAKLAASRGVAVLIVLHDFNLAARYADTLVLMREGSLVASGAPADVLSGRLLSEVFRVDLSVTKFGTNNGALIVPSCW